MPPKPDLSFSSLEEFVNEPIVSAPIVKKPVVESSEAKYSEAKPKIVRKNNGAPFIEDWVSDSEEEDVPQAKIQKKTVKPSFAKIEFVKSKEQVKSPRKTTVKKGTNFEMINKACYGNPQQDLQEKGVIASGCLRHMIRNMSYLTNFEEIDGEYVAFGGNPKGGKITGRGAALNHDTMLRAKSRSESKCVRTYPLIRHTKRQCGQSLNLRGNAHDSDIGNKQLDEIDGGSLDISQRFTL
ncbi:hypothetical protein Tco_0861246 [Tanacetum coccineum]|uniref:Uncharacterized protein n=1 Tax=Tanacetum coccineum TaxID=301880 RepID=A0ABQ5BLC9_9ASTR